MTGPEEDEPLEDILAAYERGIKGKTARPVSEKMTREELAAKVDWEGGVHEAIAGYGLSPDVLPEDVPMSVLAAWRSIYSTDQDARVIEKWLYDD